MQNQEYEQTKRECYEEYECPRHSTNPAKDAFNYAFHFTDDIPSLELSTGETRVIKASPDFLALCGSFCLQ